MLYAIPSLALFALLIPITGLTLTTAIVALVCYTLLILARNIVVGLEASRETCSRRLTAWAYAPDAASRPG